MSRKSKLNMNKLLIYKCAMKPICIYGILLWKNRKPTSKNISRNNKCSLCVKRSRSINEQAQSWNRHLCKLTNNKLLCR